MTVPRLDLPEHIEPEVGQRLRIQTPDGSSIGIDANHPLAGQERSFEIELVEIR